MRLQYFYRFIFVAFTHGKLWESEHCGSWRQKYIEFHENTLNGKCPPRYLISLAGRCGMADNISGLITQFLFALLSQRAFQRLSYGSLPNFLDAYDSPNINWTVSGVPKKLYACMTPPYEEKKSRKCFQMQRQTPKFNGMRYYPMHLTYGQHRIFSFSNLTAEPRGKSDVEVVIYSGHRGRTYATFDNPYHRGQLEKLGLKRETCFACLFHFLFRLKSEACSAACIRLRNGMLAAKEKNALIIGIQIRIGDEFLVNDTQTPLSIAEKHLRCAENITRSLPMGVAWKLLIISDSLKLKQAIRDRYGDDVVLADTVTKPMHTGVLTSRNHYCKL